MSGMKPAKYPHRSFLDELNTATQHSQHANPHSQLGSSSNFRIPHAPANRHIVTQSSFAHVLPQHLPKSSQHHYQLPHLQAPPRPKPPPARQQTHPNAPKTAVTHILPYCTTEAPLRQEQVIALSDVVGSVKELVLLAVGAAAGDSACVDKLEGAVGGAHTAGCVVEFFAGEWEVE